MGNYGLDQKEYIKAYEVLSSEDINVYALLMLTEMSYEEKERLVEYKSNESLKSEDYYSKIDICYKHLLSTYFKINSASNVYNDFRNLFNNIYLDNKDDDTNDYNDDTMAKLNKINNFINSIDINKDLSGTELLSLIRKNLTSEDKTLRDYYFDIQFREIKKECLDIKSADLDKKLELVPRLLEDIGDMESHLFRKKLFEDDYRKSVTGLTNYLLSLAELPEIYIKPIELDEYYEYVSRVNNINNEEIVTFYKEKMCDSIEQVLIAPMKKTIFYYTEHKIKKESGELENKIFTLKQNKYK